MSFELEFRGRLSRYLRSLGHDVDRILRYDIGYDRELWVEYLTSENETRDVERHMELQELLELL